MLGLPLVDDLDMSACDYVDKVNSYQFKDNAPYDPEPRRYLTEQLYKPISAYFGLDETKTRHIDFHDLYLLCD